MDNKTLKYYLALPYKTEIMQDFDPVNPGWVARVVDLPGCITQADTFAELEEMIADAKRVWIESALEDGAEIPEPRSSEDYSGKFVTRVPKSLHRRLVEEAEQEGVSLNQYVSSALAEAVGEKQARPTSEAKNQENNSLEIAIERLCEVTGIKGVHGSEAEKAYTRRMEEELTQCFSGNPETAKMELYALAREIRKNVNTSPLLMLQADLLGKLGQLIDQAAIKPDSPKADQISIQIGPIQTPSLYSYNPTPTPTPTPMPSRRVAEMRPSEYKPK